MTKSNLPAVPDPTDLFAEVRSLVVTKDNFTEVCQVLTEVKATYKSLDEQEKKIREVVEAVERTVCCVFYDR